MSSERARLISVARGETPADLILADARVVNVFSGEVEEAAVAIVGDRVAGVGDYDQAEQVLDLEGRYVAPGFINGHTHLESSMLDVAQYARAVVPRGTSTVVTDLHEIANVAGLDGIRYVLERVIHLPLDLCLMAPSCVPSTPLETSGAGLEPETIARLLKWEGCIGLGEVMNYPGVLDEDDDVLRKLAFAQEAIIDGHAPGLGGRDLNGYIAAGIGSDHESTALSEASEKLRRGMYVMIREGSSEKNLEELLPLVMDQTYKRCIFVVDDRNCADLLKDGDIDAVIRKAIKLGLDPVRAIQLATVNAAEYFRMQSKGAVAPGYLADLVVLNDLTELCADMVFYRGHLVAKEGSPLFAMPDAETEGLKPAMKVKPWGIEDLEMPAMGTTEPIIEIVPGQIITKKCIERVNISDGMIVPDVWRDMLKLVVMERHRATGNIGLGLVSGFGLKKGALASSIAHDAHNIIAVGATDEDLFVAIAEVERMGGGLAVAADGGLMASLPLPIAGLLSDRPLGEVVYKLEEMEKLARAMGSTLESPFATLSFLALPVIPEIRLTDLGLVDVNEFKIIRKGRSASSL